MKKLSLWTLLMVLSFNALGITINSAKIANIIETQRKKYNLPGVQLTVKDLQSNQSWNFAKGYSDRKTLKPLENNTLMQIGSTTKSFTASLALLLEADSEAGGSGKKFNINQTIGDWLPEYPEWKHITIRQLLNMTSGIYNYTDSKQLYIEMARNPGKTWTKDELIGFARSHKPVLLFPAGTNFAYSNTNYIIVEMILERAAGQPFEKLMDRILKKYPEYFKNTLYSPFKVPESMAHGYCTGNQYPPLKNKDITLINMSWGRAAGAIISTSEDLANWAGLVLSNKFLPAKQLNEMKSLVCIDKPCKPGTELKPDSILNGYGLGIARSFEKKYGFIWQHTGGTLGFHTVFMYLPEKKMSMALIVNLNGPNEAVVTNISNAVLDSILEKKR